MLWDLSCFLKWDKSLKKKKNPEMHTVAGGHSPIALPPQEVKGKSKKSGRHMENGVAPIGPDQPPKLGQILTESRSPRSEGTWRASRQQPASQTLRGTQCGTSKSNNRAPALSPSPRPPLIRGGRLPGAVSRLCPHETGVATGFRWMENIPSHLFPRALSRKQSVGLADNTECLLCGRHVSQGLHQCRHSVLETTLGGSPLFYTFRN